MTSALAIATQENLLWTCSARLSGAPAACIQDLPATVVGLHASRCTSPRSRSSPGKKHERNPCIVLGPQPLGCICITASYGFSVSSSEWSKILNRPEVVILDLVEQKERCVRLGLFSSSLRHRPVCLQADPHLTVSLLRQSLQAWASFCQRRISSATCHRRSGGSSRHLDSYVSLLSSCGHCRGLCKVGP